MEIITISPENFDTILKTNYVAVSYVWSQNTINVLKMRVMFDLGVFNLFSKTKYNKVWIDQISNLRLKHDGKNQVINMMNRIYSEATFTLAIIPELDVADETNIANVLARSKWMERAWTLQEQLTSRVLIVVIREKVYDITEVVMEIIDANWRQSSERHW